MSKLIGGNTLLFTNIVTDYLGSLVDSDSSTIRLIVYNKDKVVILDSSSTSTRTSVGLYTLRYLMPEVTKPTQFYYKVIAVVDGANVVSSGSFIVTNI
jgi:hypothetical protein